MSEDARVVHTVPTHLQQREPFAFGRTVGEVAKLIAVAFVAAQLLSSNQLPSAVRIVAATAVFVIGAIWALVRIQHRPLDGWLELAVRYGAMPRRRVWRPSDLESSADADTDLTRRGRYELQQVRVRWTEPSVSRPSASDSTESGVEQ
jgi:hypothetical protein